MELWYGIEDHDGADHRYQLTLQWACRLKAGEPYLEDIATDAAEDYHSRHDGWESSWPLTFVLFATEDGPEVGRFEVERESVPQFSAREVVTPSGRA